MSLATKRKLLLFLILFTAVLALIAAVLPRLELEPGAPLPRVDNGLFAVGVSGEGQYSDYKVNDFFFSLLMTMLVVVALWAIYQAIRGTPWFDLRKRLLRSIAACLAVFGVLALIVLMIPTGEVMELGQEAVPTPMVIEAVLLDEPPPSLKWVVGIVLAVGAALVAAWIIRTRPAPNQALLQIELEAEKARQALLAGESLREVILQCYRKMSNALQEDHGIERQAYMTTGDFERLLAAEGFPAAPVQQLTSLFNFVRYSRWQPGLEDELKATACLEAIIQHSRETREAKEND
ncbi:MAG: DUF4129 domain-containing protein [Anaerolineaceae bacterium]|nr:DUF4129 domain-containing protein [Anaerolineaceae bacterium]